jgi:hypothetical protein
MLILVGAIAFCVSIGNGFSFPLMIQCESDSALYIVWFAIVSSTTIVAIILRKRNAFTDHMPEAIVI